MAQKSELAQRYQEICRVYFPRWKPWKIKMVSQYSFGLGYCDEKKKILEVAAVSSEIIIHEICHAIAKMGHGKRWQDRMQKVAIIADGNDPDLAKKLRKEIEIYRTTPKENRSAKEIYFDIVKVIEELVFAGETIDIDTFPESYRYNRGFFIGDVDGRKFYKKYKNIRQVAENALVKVKREYVRQKKIMEEHGIDPLEYD